MHEFSLVQEIRGIVRQSAAENNISRITKVKVVVGKLVAVLPDTMIFCFDGLAIEPPFFNTQLEIEEVVPRGRCAACGGEFVINVNCFCCSACGSPLEVLSGYEFYVDSYEGD